MLKKEKVFEKKIFQKAIASVEYTGKVECDHIQQMIKLYKLNVAQLFALVDNRGPVLMGLLESQLSVKILVISQLSVKPHQDPRDSTSQ